jgi:hypothetical protein
MCGEPAQQVSQRCFDCALHTRGLALPSRVGPYVILLEIGSGRIGSVYCGIQHCPEREVVVKVMHGGTGRALSDDSMRAKFLRERDIAGRFEHPNILRVYDAGEDPDGQLYYVMEFAPRGTLAQHARTTHVSQVNAVRMLVEVGFAVDFAHRLGVLHRDLKPSKILIGDDMRPRVSDFSVTRLHQSSVEWQRRTDSPSDSWPYMAPEQAGFLSTGPIAQPSAAMSSQVSRASDVYSLGAILYELLSGRPPYRVNTRAELFAAIAAGPPPSLRARNISYDLEAVVMTALEHDPDQRYPSAAAFAEDLRRTLSGQKTMARPYGWRGQVVSWSTRRASWLSLWLGLWLTLIGGVLLGAEHTLHASARRNLQAQAQTARMAASLSRIFMDVSLRTREFADAPHAPHTLTHGVTPDGDAWLAAALAQMHLLSSAFLVASTGKVIAHAPPETQINYPRDLHRSALDAQRDQGLGTRVFVSPLFRSSDNGEHGEHDGHGGLVKLAFAAPIRLAPASVAEPARGVAVITISLDALAREIHQPTLALLAPYAAESSGELNDEPNVSQVKVTFDRAGRAKLERISDTTDSVYVAKVAKTGYAVMADIETPVLNTTRMNPWLWLVACACACLLASAWFVFRPSSVREA